MVVLINGKWTGYPLEIDKDLMFVTAFIFK
jgi:hypothetical protein